MSAPVVRVDGMAETGYLAAVQESYDTVAARTRRPQACLLARKPG